jgi:hypothetical protein
MEKRALKVVKTFNIWPLPVVQNTSAVYEDVCPVLPHRTSFWVSNGEVPAAILVVPVGFGDFAV